MSSSWSGRRVPPAWRRWRRAGHRLVHWVLTPALRIRLASLRGLRRRAERRVIVPLTFWMTESDRVSSPRVRGGVGVAVGDDDAVGFIPARAGRIPPRMSCFVAPERFIPARAGCSSAASVRRLSTTVYPRVCGATRVRAQLSTSGQLFRFIPARAGCSSVASSNSWTQRVHPRACGATCCRNRAIWSARGSSPRVRGGRGLSSGSFEGAGFIPARCGVVLHGRTSSRWP